MRTIINIFRGLDGNETARIKRHSLRFILPKFRLYKVWSSKTTKEYYIATNKPLPNYKYKVFIIDGGMKRLNDYLFYWRQK